MPTLGAAPPRVPPVPRVCAERPTQAEGQRCRPVGPYGPPLHARARQNPLRGLLRQEWDLCGRLAPYGGRLCGCLGLAARDEEDPGPERLRRRRDFLIPFLRTMGG